MKYFCKRLLWSAMLLFITTAVFTGKPWLEPGHNSVSIVQAEPSNHSPKDTAKSEPTVKNEEAEQTISELRAKYPADFLLSGPAHNKQVALTFDDGPDQRFTPQVLDILKQYDVKATFFLIGYKAENNPQIVRRIQEEGHIIGNHSYNHPNFPKLPTSLFELQTEQTQSILSSLIGYEPSLLRPPYGAINEDQLKWAISKHFLVVNWDVDSLDWKGLHPDEIKANVLDNVHPGAIVLQHSAGGHGQDLSSTVQALPAIIESLQRDNYELVTVPQLLNIDKSINAVKSK